jgi:hypothetical protein
MMKTLTETIKVTRRKNNPVICFWSLEGTVVIEGYGNNATEARESAEEVAVRIGLLNRPA